MNLIILTQNNAQMLAKATIDEAGLASIRRDAQKQLAIKAKETWVVYDDQDGITFMIVLDIPTDQN